MQPNTSFDASSISFSAVKSGKSSELGCIPSNRAAAGVPAQVTISSTQASSPWAADIKHDAQPNDPSPQRSSISHIWDSMALGRKAPGERVGIPQSANSILGHEILQSSASMSVVLHGGSSVAAFTNWAAMSDAKVKAGSKVPITIQLKLIRPLICAKLIKGDSSTHRWPIEVDSDHTLAQLLEACAIKLKGTIDKFAFISCGKCLEATETPLYKHFVVTNDSAMELEVEAQPIKELQQLNAIVRERQDQESTDLSLPLLPPVEDIFPFDGVLARELHDQFSAAANKSGHCDKVKWFSILCERAVHDTNPLLDDILTENAAMAYAVEANGPDSSTITWPAFTAWWMSILDQHARMIRPSVAPFHENTIDFNAVRRAIRLSMYGAAADDQADAVDASFAPQHPTDSSDGANIRPPTPAAGADTPLPLFPVAPPTFTVAARRGSSGAAEKAVAACEASVAGDPDDWGAKLQLGTAQLAAGDLESAFTVLVSGITQAMGGAGTGGLASEEVVEVVGREAVLRAVYAGLDLVSGTSYVHYTRSNSHT